MRRPKLRPDPGVCEVSSNASSDPRRGSLDEILGEMAIVAGRLDLRMAQELADCGRSLPGGFVSTLNGRQVPADASGDPCCGGLDRIASKMCVSGGGLHLRMTK